MRLSVKHVVHFFTIICLAVQSAQNEANQDSDSATDDSLRPRRQWKQQRNFSASDRLIKQLFNGYLDSIPMNNNTSNALQVKVNARILRLLDVDEIKQILKFSAKVNLEWYDDRLLWKPVEFGNLSRVEVPRSVPIWWPDVTWLERLETDFVWRAQGRVILNSNGLLTLTAHVIMTVNCYMDPGYFPFDNHRCTITFEPIVHTNDEMVITTSLSQGMNNQSLFHDQWTFNVQTPICTFSMHTYTSDASRIMEHVDSKCSVILKRKALHHIFNLFLPASIITFMTVFAFLIPPTEPDMKIQFSLSILLQLIVFLMYIYDSLPFSATRIPLLSLYFALCLYLGTISCVLTVVIAYVNWLGEDNINVPKWVEEIFLDKLGPLLVKKHLKMLRRVRNSKNLLSSTAGSSKDHMETPKKTRVSGVFWIGKIAVPLSVIFSQVGLGKGLAKAGPVPDATATDCSDEVVEKMLPDSTESNEPTRVRFDEKADHLQAPAAAHPGETMSAALRRAHSVRQPAANDPSVKSDDADWSLSKVEWSLVALILDRLCAVMFFVVYLTIILTILIFGYVNRSRVNI